MCVCVCVCVCVTSGEWPKRQEWTCVYIRFVVLAPRGGGVNMSLSTVLSALAGLKREGHTQGNGGDAKQTGPFFPDSAGSLLLGIGWLSG